MLSSDLNSVVKLRIAYSSENNLIISRRILMVIHFLERKFDIQSIANFLLVSKDQIYYWVKRYKLMGIEGLSNKKKSGRPPKISKDILLEILSKSPAELGYNADRWSYQMIVNHITDKLKIKFHPQYIYALLAKIKWKPQTTGNSKNEEDYYLKYFSYPRTIGGHKVTQKHLDLMKVVASKLNAPIHKIMTETGLQPVLNIVYSDRNTTILESRVERGKLTIKFEEYN